MSQKITPYRKENAQQEERSWEEYYPKLQRYCRFLAQNAWDGDDIAQETYLKAQKYTKHQITSALLIKIAYHHWVDMLRKRKKEMLEADAGLTYHDLPMLDDLRNSVDLVLKHFTPKQAITFVLKEAFQYQLKEIADLLNTTEMAVKANLHRAKKRLEKVEQQSPSIESFWSEEERGRLSDLFYEALKNEDPAVLIQSLPLIQSMNVMPNFRTDVTSINNHAPSSTLCMAA